MSSLLISTIFGALVRYFIEKIYHVAANMYLFKVSIRNTRKRCEICSELTKTLATFWCLYCQLHISRLFLVFLLLTLNRQVFAAIIHGLLNCQKIDGHTIWENFEKRSVDVCYEIKIRPQILLFAKSMNFLRWSQNLFQHNHLGNVSNYFTIK